MPASVLTYRNDFLFDLAPGPLWDLLAEVERYEEWWPWLTACRLEGEGLAAGSVLSGVVTPPIPFRMTLRIDLVDCQRPHRIDASVTGDLVGDARLRLDPEGEGTRVEASWTVEVRQPAMRLAGRFGRPLLQWGHDRVVDMTVVGFRRQVQGR